MQMRAIDMATDSLIIQWDDSKSTYFDYFWLRDNARDPDSFDVRSHQRELFTAALDPDIRPDGVILSDNGDTAIIDWPDVDRPVTYDASFLAQFRDPDQARFWPARQLWKAADFDAANIDKHVRIPFDAMSKSNGTEALLSAVARHGFALLEGCPPALQSVEDVVSKVGYVRETIFGGLFEFEANEDMSDSAYTPKELRPHTDGTYSHDAPGLQLLLCKYYEARGGESIMVDGLRIANDLKADDPELFDALTRIEVTGLYKGDGVELRAHRPIIRLDRHGEIEQISFNNYDRDTIRLNDRDMHLLYKGIRALDSRFNDSQYQWRYCLKPGEMLVFDNWRILHGRAAFSGVRRMAGAYVNREDFESSVQLHCGNM